MTRPAIGRKVPLARCLSDTRGRAQTGEVIVKFVDMKVYVLELTAPTQLADWYALLFRHTLVDPSVDQKLAHHRRFRRSAHGHISKAVQFCAALITLLLLSRAESV